MAATAADFPSGKAEPTRLGSDPIRRRLSRQEADLNAANAAAPQDEAQERRVQRRMRGNLPGPEGLARTFARTQPLTIAWSIGSVRWGVLASAPPHGSDAVGQAQLHRTDIRPCQRGSRGILRPAPGLPAFVGVHAVGVPPTPISEGTPRNAAPASHGMLRQLPLVSGCVCHQRLVHEKFPKHR